MKLPADGQTKMYRLVITGGTPEGKHTYANTTEMVQNRQIKAMTENYRKREKMSLRGALAQPGIPGTKKAKAADISR